MTGWQVRKATLNPENWGGKTLGRTHLEHELQEAIQNGDSATVEKLVGVCVCQRQCVSKSRQTDRQRDRDRDGVSVSMHACLRLWTAYGLT